MRLLRRAKHQYHWWVREHIHYYRRLRRGMVVNVPRGRTGNATGLVKLATWNINSITNKRQELDLYLKVSGVKLLALQETNRRVADWPIHLQEFQVFESTAEGRGQQRGGWRSQNGLALVVHKSLVAYEFGEPSPYLVGVRVMMGTLEWTVINVYLPPRGYTVRSVAVAALGKAVRAVYARDLGARLLILGDWNCKADGVLKMLRRWRQPLGVVPSVGNPASYRGPRVWSALDHFLVSDEARDLVKRSRVNRSWDLSDHWPVECDVRVVPGEAAGVFESPSIQLDVSSLGGKKQEILSHTIWDALLEHEGDDDDTTDWAELFETAVGVVAEDTGVKRGDKAGRVKPTYRLSQEAKEAIHRRRRAYSEWARDEGPVQGGPKWERYLRFKSKAHRLKSRSAKVSWLRHVTKGAEKVCDNDLGGFWRWANQIMHRGKSGPADLGPMYSEGDTLVYDPKEKLRAWQRHYEKLLGDPTGHSRDAEHWALRFPGPAAAELPGLNGPIEWRELNRALGRLKGGKAPGRDGVPPEFYKLATENDIAANGEPQSSLGRVLLLLARVLWDRGQIPERWNEAWVVSILKKGDPKRMGNYRGISLIVVMVKIVTMVVLGRLTDALEDTGWLIPQQAGFRTREECLGHVCALYEILCRRDNMGLRTYVAFIDFEKAYDTVPIEGLFRKLFLAGVTGKCLEYFRGLYANATVRIRTKSGVSEVVRILRGLRQGCNASPLLFDIFINDILSGCRHLGVRVMGLSRHGREVGLLFADDLVLISNSRSHLRQALQLIDAWAATNEMKFGAGKCGVMGFGDGALDQLAQDPVPFRLGGEEIKIVESYVYLGVPFTSPVDLAAMSLARAEKGRRALNPLRGVLACVSIPLTLRVRVVKAILVPVLTYGGELWGMLEQRAVQPQRVLSEALRLLMKLGPKNSSTSTALLGVEFNIPTVYAAVCAARARGYRKYAGLRTTISELVRRPMVSRKRTWVSATRFWLRRFCPEALTAETAEAASRLVCGMVWFRMNRRAESKSLETYGTYAMVDTQAYLWLGVRYPHLSRGFHWLTRLRLGSFWSAKRLARIGWLAAEFRTKCPFCGEMGTGEDEAHFLLVCTRWNDARLRHLGEWATTLGAAWYNLLGGSRDTGGLSKAGVRRLWCPRDPTFRPDADLLEMDPAMGHGNDDDGSMPGCVRVARYLQEVIAVRFGVLSTFLETPRADADLDGMAVLAEDGVVAEGAPAETPAAVDTRGGSAVPGP
jgi:exonuclease III